MPFTILKLDIEIEPEHRQKIDHGRTGHAVLCCSVGQIFHVDSVGREGSKGRGLIGQVGCKGRCKSVHNEEEGTGVEATRLSDTSFQVGFQRRKPGMKGCLLAVLVDLCIGANTVAEYIYRAQHSLRP